MSPVFDTELLDRIETSGLPLQSKLSLLKEVAKIGLPEGSEIRSEISEMQAPSPGEEKKSGEEIETKLRHLARSLRLLLPVYFPPASTAPGESIGDFRARLEKDIETQIRLSLGEKLTSSPYFISIISLLALCLTLFGFGLFNLRSDVKNADELVNNMKTEVTDATIQLNASRASFDNELSKNSKDFDARAEAAIGRMKDSEKTVDSIIDTKFTQQLTAVRQTAQTTTEAITGEGTKAQEEIKAAKTDQITQLRSGSEARERDLQQETYKQLQAIDKRGSELYNSLQKPTWRNRIWIGFLDNWPSWSASLLALILSIIALVRARRSSMVANARRS